MAADQPKALIGRQLGVYRIGSWLGAGGMGEVYLAKDTRLGRDVAIKILPEAFANDPRRLMRFQHEARVLASLNHPNIAALYGLENSMGIEFLVMELVDGETITERLRRTGVVPVADALQISGQVAEALATAHRKGITHRDVKPSNIKLNLEGRIKVLDFGLAKAGWMRDVDQDASDLSTVTDLNTQPGRIIGTTS